MQKMSEEYQEKKQHGSRLFPFNIYPCSIPVDFPSVALHWHNSMEIIFVKRGCGKIQMGMHLYEAGEGDIFVLPPETLHALKQTKNCVMEYENIIFEVDFLGGGAADVCAQEYLVPLAAGKLLSPVSLKEGQIGYREISECLREAERLCEKREIAYELGVKAAMLKLILILIRMYPETPHMDLPDLERLKKVLLEVEKDYRENISVTDMAKICGWSNSHFMRWFKKMTGTSFLAYLNERRLAAAAQALRGGEEKILVIAEETGFENLSNFNRQFKARYGMTPRQYRRQEQ